MECELGAHGARLAGSVTSEGIVFRQPVRRIAVLDSHDVTMA